MSAFLVNGKLITDKYDILDMWADHFEELGTPDLHTDYDNNFAVRVSAFVANFTKPAWTIQWVSLASPFPMKRLHKFVQA